MVKLIFTGGGTAGHINPSLAIAQYVRNRHPDWDIGYVGNPLGMEYKLVTQAGFKFIDINVKGFQRKISLENIRNNIEAVVRVFTSTSRAKKIIRDFEPDIVIGTGGYVTGPLLRVASKMGIKTLTHEQNAYPGVTTKLLSKHVNKVLLAVEEAKKYIDKNVETVVVGNPVRPELLSVTKEEARRKLGIADNKICVLSFGGSLGAKRINEAIVNLIGWYEKEKILHHIHATGRYGVELVPNLLKEKGVKWQNNKDIDIREYIKDMDVCLAAADVVICRAGAITISELQVTGKPSILIPSPNVAENHQYHNAKVLDDSGAAVMIEEENLSNDKLISVIESLIHNPDRLKIMGETAKDMAINDANERIYDIIYKLIYD